MRVRHLAPSWMLLCLAVGCGKTESPLAPSATGESGTAPVTKSSATTDAPSASTATASAISDDDDSEFSQRKKQELLISLKKNPKDTGVLIKLALLTQVLARNSDDSYAEFAESAQYLHQALEIDPKIAARESFKSIAGEIFYNEACSLSRNEKPEASLDSLKLAIEHGWTNLGHLRRDPDLENARQSKNYAEFEEFLQEHSKSLIASQVEALFSRKPNFKFEFDLKGVDGKRLAKKDYGGKVLMVNIWATWCGPCRAELPDLVAAHQKFKAQGFEIVGLNVESAEGDDANHLIRAMMEEFKIPYRCAQADERTTGQIPNMRGIPTSLFLDRSGKVRVMTVGMLEGEKLEAIVERLLKESPEDPVASEPAKAE